MQNRIFTYWEGPRSPLIQICLESLEAWNPGNVTVLTPADLPAEILAETAGVSRPFRSDLVRLWALLYFGGLWVDADTLCVGAVPELQEMPELDLFGVYNPHQKLGWAAGGLIGSPLGGRRGSSVLREMMADCIRCLRQIRAGRKLPYGRTSVGIASAAWRKHKHLPQVIRKQHWQLHPVPYYRAREVFFAENPVNRHEFHSRWNPNAKLYHLSGIVTAPCRNHTRQQLLGGRSFLSFLIQKALRRRPAIPGRALEIVKRLPPHACRGAEVGVFRGVNARHLLQQRKDLELLLVDRWAEYPDGTYRNSEDYQSAFSQKRWDYVFQTVLPTHLRFAAGRYKTDRRWSCEAAAAVAPGSLDFVFIDADHSYEAVLRDITTWLPRVRPGGFIGGHDYNHPREGRHYGVRRAVDETAARQHVSVQTGADYTWFIQVDQTLAASVQTAGVK